MPVMPPAVSTSRIRISRVSPSAWPLSHGSSAHGRRSIVTRISRIVMSGLAVIGVSLFVFWLGKVKHRWPPLIQRRWPHGGMPDAQAWVSGFLGNLEYETRRGGVRE